MKCQKIQDMFADEWAGILDAASREQLKAHLLECASCREEWESLNQLWNSLGEIRQEEPSAAMRPRFYAMLERYQQDRPHSRIQSSHHPGFGARFRELFALQPVFQLGLAAVLLLAGFFGGYFLKSSHNDHEELTRLREEVRETRQMVTISLLKQQSASDRLKGVSWSSQISKPDTKFLSTLIQTLNYDTSVDVRLAAVDALSRFAADPEVRSGLVKSLPKQDSPLVQISLIDLLVQLQERQAVDSLRRLANDNAQNQQVRKRAEWGLRELT